ncbi:MAG: WD40 repeat domain-containing protein [Planctomycetota bacterium]|nr:MAG: WD40 repeat domain-containing protein [Planctomycetota bacterium]
MRSARVRMAQQLVSASALAGAMLATGATASTRNDPQDEASTVTIELQATLTAEVQAPHRHQRGVVSVRFTPDGRELLAGSLDGFVRVWSTRTWKLLRAMDHGAEIYAIAISPDGAFVASTGGDARVVVWEVKTGAVARRIRLPDVSTTVAFAPEGRLLCAPRGAGVWELDPHTGQVVRTIEQVSDVPTVAVSPDGRTVATTRPTRLWDRNDPAAEPVNLGGYGGGELAFSPDGQLLLSGEWMPYALVWSIPDRALRSILKHPVQQLGMTPNGLETFDVVTPVPAAAFSPRGQYVATGGVDKVVRLWSVENGAVQQDAPLAELREPHGTVTSVAFSPDGALLAAASLDRTVRVWRLSVSQDGNE